MPETTHDQRSLDQRSLDQRSLERYQWMLSCLSIWLISGLVLNGWAHRHLPRLETFLTP